MSPSLSQQRGLLRLNKVPQITLYFWIIKVLSTTVGETGADYLSTTIGYWLKTTSFIMMIVFGFWYAKEKTLAMKSINTFPRELYYWTAVLFSFAMGTATGDLVAEKLNLGFGLSTVFFAGLIGTISFLYARFHLNGILAFWLAFILTRPLGASLGDLLSQPQANGGWG